MPFCMGSLARTCWRLRCAEHRRGHAARWLLRRLRADADGGGSEPAHAAAVAGNRVGDIGHAMQRHAEGEGFGVMRDFYGHGVGHQMHEWPSVPFVGKAGTGPELVEGMVITIEPASNESASRQVGKSASRVEQSRSRES